MRGILYSHKYMFFLYGAKKKKSHIYLILNYLNVPMASDSDTDAAMAAILRGGITSGDEPIRFPSPKKPERMPVAKPEPVRSEADRVRAWRQKKRAAETRGYRARGSRILIDKPGATPRLVRANSAAKRKPGTTCRPGHTGTPASYGGLRPLRRTISASKGPESRCQKADRAYSRACNRVSKKTTPHFYRTEIFEYKCTCGCATKCPNEQVCLSKVCSKVDNPCALWQNNRAYVAYARPYGNPLEARFHELERHWKPVENDEQETMHEWQFSIANIPVCKHAYMQWWGFPRNGQTQASMHMVEAGKIFNGKKLRIAKKRDRSMFNSCKSFLTRWYNLFGQEFVDREGCVAVQPYNKFELWDGLYSDWCTAYNSPRADYTTFVNMTNNKTEFEWVFVRKRPPVDTGCPICAKLDKMHAAIKTPEDKVAYETACRAHHNDIKSWRGMYDTKKMIAAMNPNQVLSAVIDGMGQWGIWLPIYKRVMSKDSTRKMRQKITGISLHGNSTAFYRTYPWIGCGGNLTCTILWEEIRKLGAKVPPLLYLQVRSYRRLLSTPFALCET